MVKSCISAASCITKAHILILSCIFIVLSVYNGRRIGEYADPYQSMGALPTSLLYESKYYFLSCYDNDTGLWAFGGTGESGLWAFGRAAGSGLWAFGGAGFQALGFWWGGGSGLWTFQKLKYRLLFHDLKGCI